MSALWNYKLIKKKRKDSFFSFPWKKGAPAMCSSLNQSWILFQLGYSSALLLRDPQRQWLETEILFHPVVTIQSKHSELIWQPHIVKNLSIFILVVSLSPCCSTICEVLPSPNCSRWLNTTFYLAGKRKKVKRRAWSCIYLPMTRT